MRRASSIHLLTVLLGFAALSGCAGQAAWWKSKNTQARATLLSAGFTLLPQNQIQPSLKANETPLLAALKLNSKAQFLTVFIEGDGAAWPKINVPPQDPTPQNPLALYLAVAYVAYPQETVAYLGRPCQYLSPTDLEGCPVQWWTIGRFGVAPLALINDAIDSIKALNPSVRLRLVGYSGGGAIAALLAAQRGDVACLVTVAAPLDTDAWTQAKNVSPLVDSLNPLNTAHDLKGISMSHLSGEKDTVVPPGTNRKFFKAAKSQDMPQGGFNHVWPWVQEWPALARKTCLAEK